MGKKCRSGWMVDALGRKCYKAPKRASSSLGLRVFAAVALLGVGFAVGYAVGYGHDTWVMPEGRPAATPEYTKVGDITCLIW